MVRYCPNPLRVSEVNVAMDYGVLKKYFQILTVDII